MSRPLIITLSTIPTRFDSLHKTLESLVSQSIKVEAIELYIPKRYRRFPDVDLKLPKLPKEISICVVDEDLGPATKVLPAIEKYYSQDVEILYCDDDRVCPPYWAESFQETRKERPNDAIASAGWHVSTLALEYQRNLAQPRAIRMRSLFDLKYRKERVAQLLRDFLTGTKSPKPPRYRNFWASGYVDIAEGCGGVMVQPKMFNSAVFDIPEKLWSVDDIWLSGMLAFNKIRIWASKTCPVPAEYPNAADPLWKAVIDGFNRSEANEACARYLQDRFKIWSD